MSETMVKYESKTGDKNELISALCKATLEFNPITKDSNAKVKTKTGGEYGYSYASLDLIILSTRTALSNNGLNIRHYVEYRDDGKAWLVSELRHISGCEPDKTESSIDKFTGDSYMSLVQNYGSIMTYLRRYHMALLLNIAIDEDDDGQVKEQPKVKEKVKSTREMLTAKYFKFADSNETDRHKWQLENIGMESTKDWTDADFQKAIMLLEKKLEGNKPSASLEHSNNKQEAKDKAKSSFLEKLTTDLTAISSMDELEKKYSTNKAKYESSEMRDSIFNLYTIRKKQLWLELIATKTGFSAYQVDSYMEQADDIGTLVSECVAGNTEAIEQLTEQMAKFLNVPVDREPGEEG